MRRIALGLVSAACTTVLAAVPAVAQNPHFLYATNTVDSSGALTTSFKEVGLGTGASSREITLKADASALYQCFNNGGHHPAAPDKETVTGLVMAEGTFPVRNGQTTGSLTVPPPSPGNFSCPNGQTLFLQQVTCTNTFVMDEAGNTLHATPDPISTGPIHIPV